MNGIDPNGLDCGIFSVVCGAYDATVGGLETGGASINSGLKTAELATLHGAEYAGAFLTDTAYGLAGQQGPYCGIWGAAGFANAIDETLPLIEGVRPGTLSSGVNEEEIDSVGEQDESVGSLHSIVQGGAGAREIDPSEVIRNAQNVFYDENGNQVFVWEQPSVVQITLRNPATGIVITNQRSTEGFVQAQIQSGRWWSLNG